MTTDHPTREILDRLLGGTLSNEESRSAIGHLVGRCEVCVRYVRGALRPAGPAPEAYDGLFAGMLAEIEPGTAAVRADQLAAEVLWAAVEGTPPGLRMKLVTEDQRFHSWEIASRFLEAAAEFHWQDKPRGLDACRLALAIAERLPAAAYPGGLALDLRARALGCLAEALRLDEKIEAAEAAIDGAWEALEEGTGDPLERAGLMRVAASVRLSAGDSGEAARLLRSAASIYRLYGDRHLEGRTLQKLALAVGFEDPAEGVVIAERALGLIDPEREPRLELAARHALIWFLNDCGLCWEALALLKRSRPMYRQLRESQPRLLLPWLEARICRQLGELQAAERKLTRVWHQFKLAGFDKELTLVSLDLAEVYLAQGKNRHAIKLLKSFHGILGGCRMHTEGMAAWLLLVEAAAGEAGKAQALTREAERYFRLRWRRGVVFGGGATEGAERGVASG